MNDKFFDLKTEKQDRMINASLKIFALKGYQYASTDDIVKEAGISKGLLFHYFTSKLGLYTFLADYSLRYMKMELSNQVNEKESDYFNIQKSILAARLAVLKKFPYMQQFLYMMESERDSDALSQTKEQRLGLAALYQEIIKRADVTLLKSEAAAAQVAKLVDLVLKGLMNEHLRSESFKPEKYYSEALKQIDMLAALANK